MSQRQQKTILGRKLGMTQIFNSDGMLIPVTVLRAGPCKVIQVKNQDKDGYQAYQVGFEETKKKPTKPMAGIFKKIGSNPFKYIREIPKQPASDNKEGDDITVEIFEKVGSVDVVGTSKGKGFSGTIKRWNFTSGPRAHGCKNIREIGTSGPAFPGRVIPGRHMPGQMGNKKNKVINLKIERIDKEKNLLLVRGAVPGPKGGFVCIEESAHGN